MQSQSGRALPVALIGLLLVVCFAPLATEHSMVARRLPEPSAVARKARVHGAGNLLPVIHAAAAAYDIDPAMIAAIIRVESGFNANAYSRAGAIGLMQLMPDTARLVGVRQPFDPVENIYGGTRYFRLMLDNFSGNIPLALAAYNAGPGAVERYGSIPPYAETRQYVPRVIQYYQHYSRMLNG